MFNLYAYNTRSEVVDAVRYFGSNTNDTGNPVGLQDWSYSYDNIGNRSGTMKANAAGNYTVNALNQYTERTVHGSSDIIGSAEQDVTITVNEEEATRQDYYWYHRLTLDNLYNAIYTQVVVEAIYDPGTNDPYVVSSETGSVFVAETPEVFTYDDDGNLLTDGRFEYTWDGENRLVAVETITGLPEDVPAVHVAFEYDYMSRRIGKTVHFWDDGVTNWTETSSSTFIYDGWNLVREVRDEDSEVSTNSYVFGLDLSGSFQGAGGIGGLLASVSGTNAAFFAYDANGNVSELIDSSTGDILAHYEYSPFGETIVATGDLATENKFRFSTKYFDDETGLLYYGYRFYKPDVGRWLSRDPIGERGGLNLYGFVYNKPIDTIDILGMLGTDSFPSLVGESCNSVGTSRLNLINQRSGVCFENCEYTPFRYDNISTWADEILNALIPGIPHGPDGYSWASYTRWRQTSDLKGTRIAYIRREYEDIICRACIWGRNGDNVTKYFKVDEWSGILQENAINEQFVEVTVSLEYSIIPVHITFDIGRKYNDLPSVSLSVCPACPSFEN